MRHAVVAVFLAIGLLGAGELPGIISDGLVTAVSAQPEIEIEIGEDPWYQQPVWIAIAILGGIVLILLIVLAARGGGTKVVRK